MYKIVKSKTPFGQSECLIRTSDNAAIPFDHDNTDYQVYLKWLEEGNTPEAAD